MKLWIKIFLSILLLSLTTLFISSNFIINKSHKNNIKSEQERALTEYDFIHLTILNNVDLTTSSTDTVKLMITRYGEYYQQRDINLMVYYDNEFIYNEFKVMDANEYNSLLSLTHSGKLVQVFDNNGHQYLMISGFLNENNKTILLYAKNIDTIYNARMQSIRLSIALGIGIVMVLGFFSYFYAHWITKPIEQLQKGAMAISSGNYKIHIKETKDEFNDVAKAFKHMASAVESRTLELEEKAKERQVFIDDLSHEMNTPLTSIQGYSEFLLNANASEEQKLKAANNIRTEAKRMKDIYTKLMTLTFARENELELVEVNMGELLDHLFSTFQHLLEKNHIQLKTSNTIRSLKADPTLLHMLLSNLIKNSIQAIGDSGVIEIRIFKNNEQPIIEVKDNGVGIPEDKIEEVLKPFFRVDKSRSRKTGGAGLGLSICKNITDLHNAEFHIQSKLGVGTTVYIVFNQ
jgi:signal transduction histidine kinase